MFFIHTLNFYLFTFASGIIIPRSKIKNKGEKTIPLQNNPFIHRQDLSIKKPLEGPQGTLKKEQAC